MDRYTTKHLFCYLSCIIMTRLLWLYQHPFITITATFFFILCNCCEKVNAQECALCGTPGVLPPTNRLNSIPPGGGTKDCLALYIELPSLPPNECQSQVNQFGCFCCDDDSNCGDVLPPPALTVSTGIANNFLPKNMLRNSQPITFACLPTTVYSF